jgi:hypothetical protein
MILGKQNIRGTPRSTQIGYAVTVTVMALAAWLWSAVLVSEKHAAWKWVFVASEIYVAMKLSGTAIREFRSISRGKYRGTSIVD